jgi:hypothetical protein
MLFVIRVSKDLIVAEPYTVMTIGEVENVINERLTFGVVFRNVEGVD